MKQQTEDSEWQGFEHQPEPKLQKTLQPFNLPTLSKTLNPTIKLLEQPKSEFIEEKQETTQTQTTKDKKQTISFVKNYPRIPIIRPKEDFSKKNDGTLLYRGFQPSFSDKYFKNQQDQRSIIQASNKDNLTFDSRFESGNLNTVYKSKYGAYDLYMRVDTNTQGHLQWFYFKVKNEKPQNALFTIFRFKKKISLYQRGMKPYIKSKRDGTGWKQCGYNVRYCNMEEEGKSKYYYLTFEYNFTYQNDEVYFAACPPYSYSLLMSRLSQFSTSSNCQVSQIGETLGGLSLPLVTFGNEDCKNYIVISARTHPGETSSSWVMDGIMSYLYSEKAEQLLKTVTFKIIPMLNPDGVYIGNYRTGIIGKDFNRCFNEGASNIIPQISQLKSLVKNLQKTGKILLYLDLHGHSIQRNSFIFGPELNCFPQYFREMILDMDSLSTLFKQKSCKLKTRADCVDTARGYFQNVKKIFALTIENSLGLYETHQHTYAIPTDKWRLFGKQVCQVLQKCILTEFNDNPPMYQKPEMKIVTSQLEILNKKIIDKIERRMITQKSDLKDKQKEKEKQKDKQRQKQKEKQKEKQKQKISNNKFLNKKRFQMMKWKKITQIRNQGVDPGKQILSISKKTRKLSQQIKISQALLKQQIQITQSQTTKNNIKKSKPLTQSKQSQSKFKRDTRTTFNNNHNPNLYFSMRQVNDSQLSKLKQVPDDIKDMEIQIQSPLLKPKKESIKIQVNQINQLELLNTKIVELDNLSNDFSESSDINDRQNDSDDLQPQQIKSLFHTVQMINKHRIFQFQEQFEERRVNKLKQAVQKRIHKQPSYHSVPQKMQVYNKYNELKLSLGNKSQANQFRKSFQQDKQILAIKHKYRKTFIEHHENNNFSGPTNPSAELPTLDQNTSSLLKNRDQPKDFKRPLIIPISRTPISNIYRGNIVENSIKQEILIETTKRLEKLQHQSIFSSKPFEDTFIRNKSKHLDIKRRL